MSLALEIPAATKSIVPQPAFPSGKSLAGAEQRQSHFLQCELVEWI
jgi:hypothetical protein